MMIISIVFAARLYATCNSPHFTSFHLNPPQSTSFHLISPHLTPFHLIPPQPPQSTSTPPQFHLHSTSIHPISTPTPKHHHHHPHQKRFSLLALPIKPPPFFNSRPRKIPKTRFRTQKAEPDTIRIKLYRPFFLIRIVSGSAFCVLNWVLGVFYVEEFRGGEGGRIFGYCFFLCL